MRNEVSDSLRGAGVCAGLSARGAQAGVSALHFAAQNGHEWAVTALLDAGADVNAMASVEVSVSCAAVSWRPDARTGLAQGDGSTPLHYAAQCDDPSVAGLLLNAGANPNAIDEVRCGARACDAALLTRRRWGVRGCAVDASALQEGGTPLHDAASTGKALCVALLVKHGADVNATNQARKALHAADGSRRLSAVCCAGWQDACRPRCGRRDARGAGARCVHRRGAVRGLWAHAHARQQCWSWSRRRRSRWRRRWSRRWPWRRRRLPLRRR